MSSERRYLDPWDIENYLYLRAGPIRRRSVCFDHVLQYGSYQKDGNGPIYGSLIETSKLKSDGDVYDKDRDDKSRIYNSLPSTPTQCPSCLRDYQEEADDCRKTPDTIYEDILMKTAMERRRRRIRLNKIQQAQQIDPKFGMNTLGHLRIDYSGNWNKLDKYICHP